MRKTLANIIITLTATIAQAAAPESVPDSVASTHTLGPVEVMAKGAGRRVAEGAFAVNAIDVAPMVNSLTTLTGIVDRSAGVKVRREGGAGSDFDLSINGLSGNSIRYFIDGVPLDTRGSEVNLQNIPLNIVERVELYKGVVPASFGADALGGAVNIVTKRRRTNYLDASYGIGSFCTHTGDVAGQWFIPGTSVAVRPSVGVNYSKNNYKMHGVRVWSEEEDKFVYETRRRFHDDYFSLVARIEAGVTDVKWADLFFVSGGFSTLRKDIQTGAMQTKVYGEARREARAWDIGLRYAKKWGRVNTRLQASHTADRSETVDVAERKYSWDGTWMPSSGNEMTNGAPTHRVYRRPLTIVNTGADVDLGRGHNLALNYMLNHCGNRRTDRVDKSFEPSDDDVTKQIISLAYSQSLLDGRLQNTLFGKEYVNSLSIGQKDNHTITGSDLIDRSATDHYEGAGVASRFRWREELAVKASYEHSVRLPLSRELLGNGTTVYPNLALRPESSNNWNLGVLGTWLSGPHRLSYEVNGFIRHVQNYIRANVSERDGLMQYGNEPAIDIKGFDIDLVYSFDNRLRLEANGSWSDARDLRRLKPDGNPSATYRNRVPNRPWLFGNFSASYTLHTPLGIRESMMRLGTDWQYVHWYFLNWEAYGDRGSKARIPTQVSGNLWVSCSWCSERYNLSLECENFLDRRLYDNYLLQKPGRAFHAKFRIYIQ